MSIVIKGIDRPKNCIQCPMKQWDERKYVCPFNGYAIAFKGRLLSCPTEQLPAEHGPLIDTNVIKQNFTNITPKNKVDEDCNFAMRAMLNAWIDEFPVVIEGEKNG